MGRFDCITDAANKNLKHYWCDIINNIWCSKSSIICTYYVIKFVSDLRQIGGFPRVSSINKIDCHDIAEMLLKVTLNTIKTNPNHLHLYIKCCFNTEH